MSAAGEGIGGGAAAGIGITGLLKFTTFGSMLESADNFLDAELFMALMGISLAAGGLLSAASDQRRNAALSSFGQHNDAIRYNLERQHARDMGEGAKYFLVAFLPALLGLFTVIGFDFFDTDGANPTAALTDLLELFKTEWADELIEVISSGAFLGAVLVLMTHGFLKASSGINVDPY